MGLETPKPKDQGEQSGRRFILQERLYKTKDGRIVPEGDPEANSLWKGAGRAIPMRQAEALGLTGKERSVKKQPDGDKKAAKPQDKQKKPAPKNKGQGAK